MQKSSWGNIERAREKEGGTSSDSVSQPKLNFLALWTYFINLQKLACLCGFRSDNKIDRRVTLNCSLFRVSVSLEGLSRYVDNFRQLNLIFQYRRIVQKPAREILPNFNRKLCLSCRFPN